MSKNKLLEPSNNFLLARCLITKPHFSLFPLLRHSLLCFKSIHSCLNQFKSYWVKANVVQIDTTRELIYNLFFHVLYSRQASFIYSMKSKTVDIFLRFFSLHQHFRWSGNSNVMPLVLWFAFFLFNSYISTDGGPS